MNSICDIFGMRLFAVTLLSVFAQVSCISERVPVPSGLRHESGEHLEKEKPNQADSTRPSGPESALQVIQRLLMEPHCVSCHNSDRKAGELDLSTAEASLRNLVGDDGLGVAVNLNLARQNGWKRVLPGEPARSFLMQKLLEPGAGEGSPMPDSEKTLSPTMRLLLEDWIRNGSRADFQSEHQDLLVSGKEPALTERTSGAPLYFSEAAPCAECHPSHVKEWEISNHAYAAVDPVFEAMLKLGQKETQGKLGQFCVQCHAPAAFLNESAPVEKNEFTGHFEQDLSRLTVVERSGVTCSVCHSMTKMIEPFNARATYKPDGTMRGGLQSPKANSFHESVYSPLHKTSEMCASCHAVVNPKGAPLEETYSEWLGSSFARGETPDGETKTCQSCHMPQRNEPTAQENGRVGRHDHTMVGVDVSLLPQEDFPGYFELRRKTEALLRGAAQMTARLRKSEPFLDVTITNLAGHALPSGATAERQMWLEVMVWDSQGRLVFESGTLDERGDLRDHNPKHTLAPGSDPQLVRYGQDMLQVSVSQATDDRSRVSEVVMMPWQASGVHNRLIPADGSDKVTYDLRQALESLEATIVGGEQSLRFRVRLLFRTFPMYFLRHLEENAGLSPDVKTRVPLVEMSRFEFAERIPKVRAGDGSDRR